VNKSLFKVQTDAHTILSADIAPISRERCYSNLVLELRSSLSVTVGIDKLDFCYKFIQVYKIK